MVMNILVQATHVTHSSSANYNKVHSKFSEKFGSYGLVADHISAERIFLLHLPDECFF